jgi:site-specific DNA-methyltransferase (adenine-specific)
MWIYSSGFPKSQDVGKSIQRGLGVKEKKALPKEQQTSTAGFAKNGAQEQSAWSGETTVCTDPEAQQWQGWGTALKPAHEPIALARKPIKLSIAKNAQKYGTGALNIDACRIERPGEENRFPSNVLGDIPDYQKYFYCPKVSRKERHAGYDLDTIPTNPDGMMSRDEKGQLVNNYTAKKADAGNNHPTVKPIELMKYLIKLVTPQGGVVLDPFNGSGSTGCAAVELGCEYVGIDLDPKYVEIAKKRIEAWNKTDTNFEELFE